MVEGAPDGVPVRGWQGVGEAYRQGLGVPGKSLGLIEGVCDQVMAASIEARSDLLGEGVASGVRR